MRMIALLIGLGLALGSACGAAPATTAPGNLASSAPGTGAGVYAGMTRLFDGATLEGWDGNPGWWSVKEGALYGVASKGGQLIMTRDDYDSFRLIVTSKLAAVPSNHLGVCMWGGRQKQWGYNDCLLVIPPNGGSWDYHPGGKGLPGLKTFPPPPVPKTEWHQSEIIANFKQGTITMAVNGVKVLEYQEANLARVQKGPIGMQIHAGASEVMYKDIYVEVDPKDPAFRTVK